jgi:hypothetical protein
MFAALLGYNPIHNLLDPTGVLKTLSAKQVGVLTGKQFFPNVISGPFHHGLMIVFTAAAIMSFTGAMVSLLRGKQFYYQEPGAAPLAASANATNANGANASEHGRTGNGRLNGQSPGPANGGVSPGTGGVSPGTSAPGGQASRPPARRADSLG